MLISHFDSTHAFIRAVAKQFTPKLYWRFRVWRSGYPDPEMRFLPYLCDRASASLDIGASNGKYTIHLLNYSKKCYAFEPRSSAALALAKSMTGSRSPLHVEIVALSDHVGMATMKMVVNDVGRSTIEKENNLENADDIEIVSVPIRCLDKYAFTERIGFIKIDVEGHEDAVLRGARSILVQHQPSLIIEIEERHKPGSIGVVTSWLQALGYKSFFYYNKKWRPFNSFKMEVHQNPANIGQKGRYINNFLFVTKEFPEKKLC